MRGSLLAAEYSFATDAPLRVSLTRRCLKQPIVARCAICRELSWLELIVTLDGEDQAVCYGCFRSAETFRRLGGRRGLRFESA